MQCIGNRYTWILGLAVLFGAASTSHAQIPAAPAAPAAGATATAAAGGGGNLWSFLLPTAEQRAACKLRLCNSAIGKLLNAGMQPIAAFSGGLIVPRCGLPTAADLLLPPDSAAGAAAAVKQDALEAKKRAEAVRYLGTVECNRWPEAELALINSLRGDRNECVRWEAAKALARGCCCTPKTAAALSIVVSGSNRDGFPVEKSQRVRYAAGVALDHCLACLQPEAPVLPIGAAVGTDGDGSKQKQGEGEGSSTELPAPKSLSKSATDSEKPDKPTAKEVKETKAVQPVPEKTSFYQQVDYEKVMPLVKKAETKRQNLKPTSPQAKNSRPSGFLEIVGNAFSQPVPTQHYVNPVSPAVYAPVYTPPQTVVPVNWNSTYQQPAPVVVPSTGSQGQSVSPYAPMRSSAGTLMIPARTGSSPTPAATDSSPIPVHTNSSPMPVGPTSQNSGHSEYEVVPAPIDAILGSE